MKRNKTSSKVMRRRSTRDIVSTGTQSRYARKLNSGRQVYGGRGKLSCCAHGREFAAVWGAEHRGGKPNTVDVDGNRLFFPKRESIMVAT